MQTLKSKYETKRMDVLRERVKRLDEQLLHESQITKLILEAMDEEDLQKVSAIIDKLRGIKKLAGTSLKKAIEQAEAEVNKYTAGGPLVKLGSKLSGLVGFKNPIVKVMTFANALERGFSQIPTILKNNGIDLKGADKNKSLKTLLVPTKTGEKSDEEMGKSPVTGKKVPDTETPSLTPPDTSKFGEAKEIKEAQDMTGGAAKLKNIVAQLQKALSPGGIFGAFKKVPYIDSTALADELTKLPIMTFSNIANSISQGIKTDQVAPDMKDVVRPEAGGAASGGGGTTPGELAQPTAGAAQAAPAKDTTVTTPSVPPGEKPIAPPAKEKPNQMSKEEETNFAGQVASKLKDVDAGSVQKVIGHLNSIGKLRGESFIRSNR